jgi:hypothetical protein
MWWAPVSAEQKQYVAALQKARAALSEARSALASAAHKLDGHPLA